MVLVIPGIHNVSAPSPLFVRSFVVCVTVLAAERTPDGRTMDGHDERSSQVESRPSGVRGREEWLLLKAGGRFGRFGRVWGVLKRCTENIEVGLVCDERTEWMSLGVVQVRC